jgi:primosomal replication protein N
MSSEDRFWGTATPVGKAILPAAVRKMVEGLRAVTTERAAVFRRIAKDVVYAIGPTAQMDGAVAWLVRYPPSKDPLLVVLSKDDLSDRAFLIARTVMYHDVSTFPTTNGRRIVKLYRDQRVVIEEGGTSRTAWTNISLAKVSNHIAPNMLQGYQNGRSVHVSGFGDVRTVREAPSRMKPTRMK